MRKQNVQKTKRSQGRGGRGVWLPLGVTAILAVTLAMKCSLASRQGIGDSTSIPSIGVVSTDSQTAPGEIRFTAPSVVHEGVRDGVWSVDDSIWSFENQEVSSAQLTSLMRQPPSGDNPVESAAPEHLALLDLIPIERATVERLETLALRSIDFGTVRASLCYRESNGQQFILDARVAHQIDIERWQVITLKPRLVGTSKPDHLLPVSGKVVGVCQRVSRAGQLQCEILETNASMGELIRGWQSVGWLVQDSGTSEPSETNLICCCGNQSIQVRATQRVSEAKLTLVLTALHNL